MFVLAEPEDLVIVCGEFNSGVEIINESWEPEQVFTVTKIIQHPDYKPTSVGILKKQALRSSCELLKLNKTVKDCKGL